MMNKMATTSALCLAMAGTSSVAYAHAGEVHAGPAVTASKVPAPAVGESRRRIGVTSEQPAGSDVGAFRTRCEVSHFNSDDPIVYPRQPGKAHHHMFFGNTGTNAHSTYESLRDSGNSTCRGGIANRSAYWVPSMIDTATSAPVVPDYVDVYYKSGYNGLEPSEIRPLPRGLRMVAGAAASTAAQENAFWGCRDQYVGQLDSIPIGVCSPGDAVLLTVKFPQCWDGVNLDSANHKSHLSTTVAGDCPSTHPVALPEITFNVSFPVPADGDTSTWRLSSDTYDETWPGGMSAHADYFEAWEASVADAWANNCVKTGKDCHSHLLGDGRQIE